MDGAIPPRRTLPTEIAVFPLAGALLLPGGRLPLNIFEPRYLAMIEDTLASGRHLGMIQPEASQPAGPDGPSLFRIGCLGRLSSFSETDDGRFLITLTGVCRFTVLQEIEMRRGYRRVRVDFAGFDADLAAETTPEQTGDEPLDRAGLLGTLRTYFTSRGFSANWGAIESMADDALVITLCMVCPFEPAEKQALLEAPGQADRVATLRALLAIGSHGTAASGETLS